MCAVLEHLVMGGGTAPAAVPSFVRGWLGRQDSNLGMSVPKTDALPLGDAPKADADSRTERPYRQCR